MPGGPTFGAALPRTEIYRKALEAALPRSFQTQIPRTNIHRWRTEPGDKYQGAAINAIASEQLELLQQVIEDFIAQNRIPIQKKIALRDVHFNNSLVESVNKLLKYRYLFPRKVANGAALTIHLAASIQDYNDVRPHGSLNGLTPTEAYQRQALPERPYAALLKQAKTARLIKNRQDKCGNRAERGSRSPLGCSN